MKSTYNNSLGVKETDNRGRIVVANCYINASEVVSVEPCIAFALSNVYNDVGCTFCSHLCVNEMIYGSANTARYCSKVSECINLLC